MQQLGSDLFGEHGGTPVEADSEVPQRSCGGTSAPVKRDPATIAGAMAVTPRSRVAAALK